MLSAFFVNSLADSHDAIPGDGVAEDANGFTTLRAALEEANSLAGTDTITLPAGVIALSASNGPLAVTDDVTIFGSGASVIDGTAFDEVFAVRNGAQFKFDNVDVFSSGPLAASLRPTLLTTNARQADLIVAFSATPAAPFVVDTKSVMGLSSLVAGPTPEIVFDELSAAPVSKLMPLGDLVVPTPEQAIDEIIDALFRNEPDFVLPVSAEQNPEAFDGENARPMSKSPPKIEADPAPESMPSDDEEVGAILHGWADEAGWGEFDFLTRGSHSVTAQPRRISRVAVMAGALLSGLATSSWRDSISPTNWRTRFERLRRRAR